MTGWSRLLELGYDCPSLNVKKYQLVVNYSMKFTILGSGGVHPIPLPACQCRVCILARKEGGRHKRGGPSVFVHDLNLLIDTPEDVYQSLNAQSIKVVDRILFSHWHPDHVLGFRVIEALREREFSDGREPIDVYIPAPDIQNFKNIIPSLWYLEKQGFIQIHEIDQSGLMIEGVKIKPVLLKDSTFFAYLFEQNERRALICMDHSMLLRAEEALVGVDVLMMNLGFLEGELKHGTRLPEDHRIRSLTGFDKDNVRLLEAIKPKRAILAHIEDRWNRTPEELDELVMEMDGVEIAYDGLTFGV